MKQISAIFTLIATAAFVTPAFSQDTNPTSTGKQEAALFEDEVIASGKGMEIKRSELDELTTGFKATAAGRGQPVSDAQMHKVERELLGRLIQLRLIYAKASDEDKAAGLAEAERRIGILQDRASSVAALEAQLKSMGLTVEDLKKRFAEEATAQEYLQRTLKPKEPFTEEQAREYYNDNPENFEAPEMVRAAHVLISTRDPDTQQPLSEERQAARRKLAEDILKRARDGEDFAKLAKEYSDDPGSKDKGGEYTFPRGKMVPEFEAAAFSLKTNEVSDIVTTQYGYHIIKLYEKMPAEKKPFAGPDTATLLRGPDQEEVTIKDILTDQAIQKKVPEFLAKMKEDAGVKILDEDLKLPEVDSNAVPVTVED